MTDRPAPPAAPPAGLDDFQALLDSIQDVFYRVDADGLLRVVSRSGARALGYDHPDELIGRPAGELWARPDRRAALLDALDARDEVSDWEAELVRRDGEIRLVTTTVRAIRDASGGWAGYQGIWRDVTDRRRAEEALRLQERRMAQAVEGADLGTWEWIPGTTELTVNDRYLEMLGYGRAEVASAWALFAERLHPEDARVAEEALGAHLSGAAPSCEMEVRLRHRDGQWIWILARGRALDRDADGRPLRVAGTHLDVTARKRLEAEHALLEARLRQAQKLEAVGQVAGGVAHDFNNLLTVQLGNLTLLRELPGLPAEAAELLEEVERSARAAAGLTRQLLAFGRRSLLQPRRLDLNEVLDGFSRLLRRVVREDVAVEVRRAPGPLLLDADAGMLEQVVMNLTVNARDAMPDGGRLLLATGSVEVAPGAAEAPAEPRPGPYVTLAVTDSGHGMDEETQQRIFEPFFTTKPPGQGTGLGLATVYGIVQQHGGWIGVASAPGRGTTVTVHWPAAQGPAPAEREAAPPSPRGGGQTVLLVEDDAPVRRAVRATLDGLGYRVVEAGDAASAREVWTRLGGAVDVLLTDVVMPGGSGLELARAIRALRPDVPVILMSGYSDDLAARGAPAGMALLPKPCGAGEVALALARALGRR